MNHRSRTPRQKLVRRLAALLRRIRKPTVRYIYVTKAAVWVGPAGAEPNDLLQAHAGSGTAWTPLTIRDMRLEVPEEPESEPEPPMTLPDELEITITWERPRIRFEDLGITIDLPNEEGNEHGSRN
jgi:hypothetical protein